MVIKLELNPDEALALIQMIEGDLVFPDVAATVIEQVDRQRAAYWANDVRNLAYLRAEKKP